VVFVFEVPEGSGDHYITKVTIGPQGFDPAGVSSPSTKVTPAKGYSLALADQPRGYAFDCLFP
jgi:hypothetical protein